MPLSISLFHCPGQGHPSISLSFPAQVRDIFDEPTAQPTSKPTRVRRRVSFEAGHAADSKKVTDARSKKKPRRTEEEEEEEEEEAARKAEWTEDELAKLQHACLNLDPVQAPLLS